MKKKQVFFNTCFKHNTQSSERTDSYIHPLFQPENSISCLFTHWELDNRHAPEYVLRLLEYYIRHENLYKEREGNK